MVYIRVYALHCPQQHSVYHNESDDLPTPTSIVAIHEYIMVGYSVYSMPRAPLSRHAVLTESPRTARSAQQTYSH